MGLILGVPDGEGFERYTPEGATSERYVEHTPSGLFISAAVRADLGSPECVTVAYSRDERLLRIDPAAGAGAPGALHLDRRGRSFGYRVEHGIEAMRTLTGHTMVEGSKRYDEVRTVSRVGFSPYVLVALDR
jgi:hypothetical protein